NVAENGLGGWTAYLDLNNNGQLDGNDIAQTTDADGYYQFTNLADGNYIVRRKLPAGYRKTLPGTGISSYDATITAASTSGGNDSGLTTNILLAGAVFNDANSNGVKDAGETGIANVVVNIISNGSTIASRTTDANGFWQVKGLSEGTGQAKAVIPSGYTAV